MKQGWIRFFLFSFVFGACFSAAAGELVEYKIGNQVFEGYLAKPTTKRLNNPAVLIVHDWMGMSPFVQKKADEMAEMGYVAFAVDAYGKGHLPKNQQEAGEAAGKLKKDVKVLRERMLAGLEILQKNPLVDKSHIVAFGYCFGGTASLELARSGAELKGIASFHGGLSSPKAADAKNIKGRVLIMHGAIDPFVPVKEVADFQREMDKAGIDYQFISYSGAVHAFAIKEAGNNPKLGFAYNQAADERSWAHFRLFLEELQK